MKHGHAWFVECPDFCRKNHVQHKKTPIDVTLDDGWSFDGFCELVGGWTNPSEKYARQIGSFPQGRDENKKIFETTT